MEDRAGSGGFLKLCFDGILRANAGFGYSLRSFVPAPVLRLSGSDGGYSWFIRIPLPVHDP